MRRLIPLALSVPLLAGCGATLRGGSSVPEPAAGTAVAGLPYRVRDQLGVEVYRLTDKGYVFVGRQTELMADPARLYMLNFRGMPLADATLKIEQRPDGSLSVVNLGSTGKAAELGTGLAAGIDALQAANKANDDARKAAIAAQQAATTATATEVAGQAKALQDAVRARDEVQRLTVKLEEDRATLKPSEVLAAESAIRIAKMQANTAAVLVGQAIPFPQID